MVYFLASGPDHVKIGYIQDWQRLHTRVRTLQSGNPHHELSVLHVLPGLGPASEHLFHRELSAARLTGEWFDADHDDVRQVIIAAHTGEFDTPEQVSLWAAERQAAREAERRSMSREAIARRAYERQLAEGSLTVRPLDA